MTFFKKHLNHHLLFIIVGIVALLLLSVSTNPFEAGPIIVLAFLSLVFLVVFSLTRYSVGALSNSEKLGLQFSSPAIYYSSILISTGAVFLIGTKTIGQLQLVDLLLVACFELLANFYVLRRL